MNASLMTFKSIFILRINRVKLSGSYLAAIFTVAGFSFFGKNLLNSLPIIAGVFLYSKLQNSKFERHLLPAFFGTALGPLVSEICFNMDIPLYWSIPAGFLVGLFVGMILPPLAEHVKCFHKGYILYNIGFTAGLIGTLAIAVLRSMNAEIEPVDLAYEGDNSPFVFLLSLIFSLIFIWGLVLNKWSLRGFFSIIRHMDVENRDYILLYGSGITLINMAVLGMVSMLYVLLVDGSINGPVIGGILTIVGFAAYGKNLRNILPIFFGVYLAGLVSLHDTSSTVVLLAALFGTSLAPISQRFGPIAGIVAGAMQLFMVVNINYIHAGMNLYNNGFSAAFIAAALLPIIEALVLKKEKIIQPVYNFRNRLIASKNK